MKISARRLRLARFLATAWAAALLAGCGPIYHPGLSSVSPDGRLAVVSEAREGADRMTALDLETGRRGQDKSFSLIARSSFSPDGKYFVASVGGGWTLFDASDLSAEGVTVGESVGWAEFLPNGDLIVAKFPGKGVALYQVAPGRTLPADARPLAEGRYVISSSKAFMALQFFLFTLGQSASQVEWDASAEELMLSRFRCPEQARRDRISWILIAQDYSVSVLIATRRGTEVRRLDPSMTRALSVLLDQQAAAFPVTAGQTRRFEDDVRKSAARDGKTLSEADVTAAVAAQAKAALWGNIASTTTGLAGPDGESLFFVRMEAAAANPPISLHLVLLDGSEFPVPLATVSSRFPQFDYSPDGSQMFYEKSLDGVRGYYAGDADGTDIRRLPVDDAAVVCWN